MKGTKQRSRKQKTKDGVELFKEIGEANEIVDNAAAGTGKASKPPKIHRRLSLLRAVGKANEPESIFVSALGRAFKPANVLAALTKAKPKAAAKNRRVEKKKTKGPKATNAPIVEGQISKTISTFMTDSVREKMDEINFISKNVELVVRPESPPRKSNDDDDWRNIFTPLSFPPPKEKPRVASTPGIFGDNGGGRNELPADVGGVSHIEKLPEEYHVASGDRASQVFVDGLSPDLFSPVIDPAVSSPSGDEQLPSSSGSGAAPIKILLEQDSSPSVDDQSQSPHSGKGPASIAIFLDSAASSPGAGDQLQLSPIKNDSPSIRLSLKEFSFASAQQIEEVFNPGRSPDLFSTPAADPRGSSSSASEQLKSFSLESDSSPGSSGRNIFQSEAGSSNNSTQAPNSSGILRLRSGRIIDKSASSNVTYSQSGDQHVSSLTDRPADEIEELAAKVSELIPFEPPALSSRQSIIGVGRDFFKQAVFTACKQHGPIPWDDAISERELEKITKIGEGTFGEVFRTVDDEGDSVALKVIPIQGTKVINGERQKEFWEIYPEIFISRTMSDLRRNEVNATPNFVEVKKVHCVRGRYPERFLDSWTEYNEKKRSENEFPDVFDDDQLFIIFVFGDGGCDLESVQLKSVAQAKSIVRQLAMALAIAEVELQFEHRDLHIGNVLVKETVQPDIEYVVEGRPVKVESCGVQVFIIDFTLSRVVNVDQDEIIFANLATEPDFFTGQGDYQFDIYRQMRDLNGNEWKTFSPKTNIFWLDYLMDKLITWKRYGGSRKKGMGPRQAEPFNALRDALKDYGSCKQLVSEHEFFA